ncbi:MAG: hypothetical protein COA92_02200 [Sulfurovum sp.]|nr:MAG: hypothetical protein COA92_02200 [Sulfurovum sp.]
MNLNLILNECINLKSIGMKALVTFLFLLLIIGSINPVKAQNTEILFQQGMMQEQGEGNLNAALEIYNQLANDVSVNRTIRAKALLQAGSCYEKLGNQNARISYQKLIADFSDQLAIVALAKEKLKGLKKQMLISKNEGIVVSEVWSNAQDTYSVSPDGRYLNYIDWDNISINLKDLKTGKTRVISKVGTWIKPMQFPDKSIWSPDGKKLAYYWYGTRGTELHIVNFDGSSDKIIAKGKEETTPWPVSWTPDGNYILAITTDIINNNKNKKIVQVSVNEGTVKIVKDFKNLDCGCSMDISPDNKFIVYTIQQSWNSKLNDIRIISLDNTLDTKLVSNRANNTSPLWSPNGKEVLFMSDQYGTNDLWKIKVENGYPVGDAKIVKWDLGFRHNLLEIANDGSIFFESGNTKIDVYIANMKKDSRRNSKNPIKISTEESKRNMNAIWSPNGQFVSYTRYMRYRDGMLGHKQQFSIYDTKNGEIQKLDTKLFGNIVMYRPQWTKDNEKLLIQGLVKDNFKGGLFLLNVNTGKETSVKTSNNMSVDKINDMYRSFLLTNDNNNIYYFSEDRKSILKYTINTKKETTILSGTKTLHYFRLSNDDLKIAFGYWFNNDKGLYTVSTSGGEKKKIMEFEECDCADNLIAWGKNDEYLYFKRGKFRDFKKLMRISVEGGIPEEVMVFKDIFNAGTITQVNISPDEEKILVELQVGSDSVWKLEGVFDE